MVEQDPNYVNIILVGGHLRIRVLASVSSKLIRPSVIVIDIVVAYTIMLLV